MGARPPKEVLGKIREAAKSVKSVKKFKDIRAHYVGDRVHVELSIVLSKNLKTKKAHDIGEQVQKAVENVALVSYAFVHIDYE